MTALVHRVALVDARGALVRGPIALDDSWPSPRDLREAVAAPRAVEVVPAWRGDDGVIVHVLQDAAAAGDAVTADDAGGTPWSPAAPALAQRASGGGEGWADWYRPQWRAEVDVWTAAVLRDRGLRAVAEPEIVTWWALSAVLRVPVASVTPPSDANTVGVAGTGVPGTGGTDAGVHDVWFKATCEGFRDEPVITAGLAQWPEAPVPAVLGVDADRAWMLLTDVPGAGDEPPLDTVLAAARAMAQLQLASIGRDDPALPLRDAPATIRGLATVVHDSVEAPLMDADLREAARVAEPRLAAAVQALYESGLPLTLVHGDLHTQNLAGTAQHPVIFDWTDACRAHPYLDGRLLAASAVGRRPEGTDPDEVAAAVRDAFTAPWRAEYPAVDHDLAWECAGDALRVFEVVSYESIQRAQPAASRWALEGILTGKLTRLVVGGDA